MPLWSVPKMWERETCAVLGGGPGLRLDLIGRVRELGWRSVAVNNAYKVAPWADVLYYGDCNWLRMCGNEAGVRAFGGLIVSRCPSHASRAWVKVVKHQGGRVGLSLDPACIHWHSNSGAAAINLAVLLGAGRIVLMGFDMRDISTRDACGKEVAKRNWHDDYPAKTRPIDVFPRFMRGFPGIAAHLDRLKIPCVNATPGSALKEFPIVEPEEVLCVSSACTAAAATTTPTT
jgi:hypothetical protein